MNGSATLHTTKHTQPPSQRPRRKLPPTPQMRPQAPQRRVVRMGDNPPTSYLPTSSMTTPAALVRRGSSSAKMMMVKQQLGRIVNSAVQGRKKMSLVVVLTIGIAAVFTLRPALFNTRVVAAPSDTTTTTFTSSSDITTSAASTTKLATSSSSSLANKKNNPGVVASSAPLPPLRTVKLRSGLEMPAIGYGTCCRPSAHGEAIYESTKLYLKHGGRLIDTAMSYKNHKELGRAIADVCKQEEEGIGISRRDIWITSKISTDSVHSYKQTIQAVDVILQELDTDYLDLILIHWPKLGKEKTSEIWRGLIQVQDQGKVRAIGVSNFNTLEIQDISNANHGVMPEVNEIQLHPWTPVEWRRDVVDWCKQHGVAITAYSSLGGSRFHQSATGGADRNSKKNNNNSQPTWPPDIVARIGKRYGATPSQVLLQWALRQGVAVIPGSGSEAHIIENLMLVPTSAAASQNNNNNRNESTINSIQSALDNMTDEEAAAIEATIPPSGWWDPKRGPFKMAGTAAEIAWEHDF